MKQLLFFVLVLVIIGWTISQDREVLIIADEKPAMEVLAKALKDQEGINSTIIEQNEIPESINRFQAVIVYIHGKITAESENAFIKYANNGGKLICLHHTIGSGKKTNNKLWLPFLGVDLLLKKDPNEGGYKYTAGIDMQIVNLASDHFITTNKVKYDLQVPYTNEKGGREKILPGFTISNTEIFLNHVLVGPRTILLGFKYKDADGKVWMQDRATWYKPVGKGWLFYSMPGHSVHDFENPTYARIIINAIIFKQ